jgi:signal transduction histidine kinase
VPIVLCAIDADWNITSVDGKILGELGLTPEKLVGQSLFQLLPESQELRAQVGEVFTGKIVRTIAQLRDNPLHLTLLPLVQKNSWVSGVILIATLERRKDDRAPAEASDAQLATGRNLTLQVTHELRTPLNSILGFANLLLKSNSTPLSEQERFYLQRIIGNTNHLLLVIGQVVDLSLHARGKSAPDLKSEDLKHLVEETLEELKGLVWSESVTIVSNIPPGIQPVQTDRVKLKQILINLISNALKYTHQGSIAVSVIVDDRSNPIRIDVADTGEGIPNEKLGAIFEAFDRGTHKGDQTVEGVGLGLAIVRSLASMLGYTVSVRSEVKKGSTFSLHLVPPPVPL